MRTRTLQYGSVPWFALKEVLCWTSMSSSSSVSTSTSGKFLTWKVTAASRSIVER
jgi:hypothetical protein